MNLASFTPGPEPTAIASADINGDNRKDLIIANHNNPFLTLMLADDKGGFYPATNPRLPLSVMPHPHMVTVADMDQDGLYDLVVDSRDHFGLFILRGLGNERFETPGKGIDVGGGPYLGFAVGDINGDGRPDLATPNARDIRILINVSSSPLILNLSQSIPFPSPIATRLIDINDDDETDLVVASVNDARGIGIFLGDGSGHFNDAPDYQFSIRAGAKNMAIGDMNGDGLNDIVVTSWGSDIQIIYGANGKIEAQPIALSGLSAPWGVATGDLNGDGRDDIIVADGVTEIANIYLSESSHD